MDIKSNSEGFLIKTVEGVFYTSEANLVKSDGFISVDKTKFFSVVTKQGINSITRKPESTINMMPDNVFFDGPWKLLGVNTIISIEPMTKTCPMYKKVVESRSKIKIVS